MESSTRRQVVGAGALVAVAVVAAALYSPNRAVRWLAGLGERPFVFLAALAVLYAVRPAFAWPISPISALVGFVLGVTYGVPVALVGATLTCIPPFLFARYWDAPDAEGVLGWLGDAGQRMVGVTGQTRGVFAARLSPVPADPVSYGAGVSGVSARAFLVGTLVGEVPWIVLEVLAGASMRHLTFEGLGAGLHVLLGSLAVTALVLAGPAYRHVRERRATGQ